MGLKVWVSGFRVQGEGNWRVRDDLTNGHGGCPDRAERLEYSESRYSGDPKIRRDRASYYGDLT